MSRRVTQHRKRPDNTTRTEAVLRLMNFGLVLWNVGIFAIPQTVLWFMRIDRPSIAHLLGVFLAIGVGLSSASIVAERFSTSEHLGILGIFLALTFLSFGAQAVAIIVGTFILAVMGSICFAMLR
jgi:hypothetical protein